MGGLHFFHNEYLGLRGSRTKTFPSATVMSLMWNAVEDSILSMWSVHMSQLRPRHLSLHFDGIRIDREVVHDIPKVIEDCLNMIFKKTGFDVKIVSKQLFTMLEMRRQHADTQTEMKTVPAVCLKHGNCIPCSLWHVVSASRAGIRRILLDGNSEANKEAEDRGRREYRAVAQLLRLELRGCAGLPGAHVKSFILHMEQSGTPHCVAVQMLPADIVTVSDGSDVFRMKKIDFMHGFTGGMDHSTAVSFWHRSDADEGADNNELLLQMSAGASGDDGTDDDINDISPHKNLLVDDEGDIYFEDDILLTMKHEVERLHATLADGGPIRRGKLECSLCPFRKFNKLKQLKTQVAKYHIEKRSYVCSGTVVPNK